jgi:hypothetical protein
MSETSRQFWVPIAATIVVGVLGAGVVLLQTNESVTQRHSDALIELREQAAADHARILDLQAQLGHCTVTP